MRAWWDHLMTDESFFWTSVAKGGRFLISVVAIGITSWAGAPEWAVAIASALGLLVAAGDKNSK